MASSSEVQKEMEKETIASSSEVQKEMEKALRAGSKTSLYEGSAGSNMVWVSVDIKEQKGSDASDNSYETSNTVETDSMSNYDILKDKGEDGVVGKGYQGVVLVCKRVTDGHKTVKKGDIVAIKQAQYYTRDARKQASLRNEAKILTELKHKNIVQCFGNFIEHGNIFTVFEYIDGGDLHSYLEPYSRANPKKRVPNNIVCNILQQLLSAVSCLRENKVLQRDLKIQNVMYNEKNGMLKVVDFGLAKKFTKSNQFSTSVLGTYALTFSPEMANNIFSSDIGTPYSYAHDMFGVGMMMYSMVVLTDCPWENDSPKTPYEKKQLVQEIKNKPVVLRVGEGVLDGCTEYGQDFLDLVNSCMEKDPKRRPTAVAAMKRLKMYRIKTVKSYAATKIQAAFRKVFDIRKCLGISGAFKQVSNDAKGTGFVVVSEGAFQTENGKNDKVFNAYGVDVEKYREWYRKYQVTKPLLEKAAKDKEEKEAMKLQLLQERADKEALRQALQLQNEKHSLNFSVLARILKESQEQIRKMQQKMGQRQLNNAHRIISDFKAEYNRLDLNRVSTKQFLQATSIVQRAVRMLPKRSVYKRVRKSFSKFQAIHRKCIERENFLREKGRIIYCQAIVRRFTQQSKFKRLYKIFIKFQAILRLKARERINAAVNIQTFTRKQFCVAKYKKQKQSAVKIQKLWRGFSQSTKRSIVESWKLKRDRLRTSVAELNRMIGAKDDTIAARNTEIAELNRLNATKDAEIEAKTALIFRNAMAQKNVTEDLVCPIAKQPMYEPVLLVGDGHTYEKKWIEEHLKNKNTSPLTNAGLTNRTLIPNHTVKKLLNTWYETDDGKKRLREMYEELKKKYLEINESQDIYDTAIKKGNLKDLTFMLNHYNAIHDEDISMTALANREITANVFGFNYTGTALAIAALHQTDTGVDKIIRYLLDHGADVKHVTNDWIYRGNEQMGLLLLNHPTYPLENINKPICFTHKTLLDKAIEANANELTKAIRAKGGKRFSELEKK